MAQRPRAAEARRHTQGLKYYSVLESLLKRLSGTGTAPTAPATARCSWTATACCSCCTSSTPSSSACTGCGRRLPWREFPGSARFVAALAGLALGGLPRLRRRTADRGHRRARRPGRPAHGRPRRRRAGRPHRRRRQPASRLAPHGLGVWTGDGHRTAKLHLQFNVLRGIAVRATVTDGNGCERTQLRKTLMPGRLYVVDRGYIDYPLYRRNHRRRVVVRRPAQGELRLRGRNRTAAVRKGPPSRRRPRLHRLPARDRPPQGPPQDAGPHRRGRDWQDPPQTAHPTRWSWSPTA